MKVKIYNLKGKETTGERILDSKKELNDNLMHIINRVKNIYSLQSGNTKTRGERRGGGIKPWRQKGTGRARVGSNRSPIWRKGGITFGPRKEKNYKRQINKNSLITAKRYLLNKKIESGEVFIWQIRSKDIPKKTKEAELILLKLPIKQGVILILSGLKEKFRSLKNIPYLTIKNSNSLSIADLLRYSTIIFTQAGYEEVKGIKDEKKHKA